MYSIHLRYYMVCQELEDCFTKVHVVNTDSLVVDGAEFWNKVKTFIPDLDLNYVLLETAEWIYKNNKLVEKFNNDYL
jgi:hypothetical protein